MSQDRLDQFFRDMFSSADPVAPSPGDWAAAKALLDLEKKDDDRPLLWWLLLLGVVNLLLVFFLDAPERSLNLPNLENVERQPMANESSTPQLGDVNDDLAYSNILEDQDDVTEGGKRGALVVTENSERSNKREESAVISNNPTSKSPNVGAKKSLSVSEAQGKDQISPEDANISNQIPSEEFRQHDNREKQMIPRVSDLQELVGHEQGLERRNLLESLTYLDSRSSVLDHQYDLDQPQPNGSKPLFDRPKFRQTKYGWSGTLLLNPVSQVSDPVQGVRFGFLAEYYFAKNWLIGMRPSMQITLNETGFSKFEVQTTFSFSAVSETYGLQATSLQFISLPIYLAWTEQKHTLELGGGIDWLIAARGQVQQVQIENNGVETLSALGNGWIDTDQMAQFSSKLFFGYKFAINYRLKAGMTLFYNPTNLYPGFDGRQFQHNRKWYMGIQANYYLN